MDCNCGHELKIVDFGSQEGIFCPNCTCNQMLAVMTGFEMRDFQPRNL
jgi:hypothetical protein